MRSNKLHQLHVRQLSKQSNVKDVFGAKGVTFFQTLPVLFDTFTCTNTEVPHNYNNGFFRNVFIVRFRVMNPDAFQLMESISDQVRLPSMLFHHSTTFKNRSHAFKTCDYKVCSRFVMPVLLFVSGGYTEEVITHFCELEDTIEHLEDKNGRILTVGRAEEYAESLIERWYPKFNELYDHRLSTLKFHLFLHIVITVPLYGKLYGTSSNPFESKGGRVKKFIRGSHHAHLTTARNIDNGIKVKVLSQFAGITEEIKEPVKRKQYFKVTVNGKLLLSLGTTRHVILDKETLFAIEEYRPKLGKVPKTDNSWCFLKLFTASNEEVYYYGNILAIEENEDVVGLHINLYRVQRHLFGYFVLLSTLPCRRPVFVAKECIERQVAHHFLRGLRVVRCTIPHSKFKCN